MALFKASSSSTGMAWKCLTLNMMNMNINNSCALGTLASASTSGSSISSLKNGISGNSSSPNSWFAYSTRDFMTNQYSSATPTTTTTDSGASALTAPIRRAPNVFARFVKQHFPQLPAEMSNKEKFRKAAEAWKELSEEQKDEYKRETTEGLLVYRKKMSDYLESLTPEELVDFKKLKKEKIRTKTRQRIKHKLRELNYPKRNLSAYIYYTRDQLEHAYPDGKFPSLKSPEHIRSIGVWAQRWKTMSPAERKPFEVKAEADRARYFAELEEWKSNLAKPENEMSLMVLERLSRKVENTKKEEAVVKEAQRKVAAKVIRTRLEKKAKKEAAAQKKTGRPKKVVTTTTTEKGSKSIKSKKAKKDAEEEEED